MRVFVFGESCSVVRVGMWKHSDTKLQCQIGLSSSKDQDRKREWVLQNLWEAQRTGREGRKKLWLDVSSCHPWPLNLRKQQPSREQQEARLFSFTREVQLHATHVFTASFLCASCESDLSKTQLPFAQVSTVHWEGSGHRTWLGNRCDSHWKRWLFWGREHLNKNFQHGRIN